jgi:phage terminase large subunit-like protein
MHDNGDIEVGRLAAEIDAAAMQARRYRAKDFWTAYPKQLQFFATGRFRERGLFAGTQLGKTECAAYELACHLTGEYPPDWPGRRFDRAVKVWAVGENLKMARDIQQKKLFGEPGNVESFGSGMVPRDAIIGNPILARGEGNAFDTVSVRHRSGGISTLRFRTYSAGEMALQGETLDIAWLDEEPERIEVYNECLARTAATGGMLMITFTPLKGMTGVSQRFREEFSPSRTYVQFSIDDVPLHGHIPPARRASIIASYAEHEREARSRGEPMLGEGKIYRTPESEIVEDLDPLQFPTYWRWGWGIDFGISHNFAAALIAHDTDQDVIHLVGEVRMSDATISAHVSAMRALEQRIFFGSKTMEFPVAWPHDGGVRDRGSGEAIIRMYKQFGLRTMAGHATHANVRASGSNRAAETSLEAGLQEINAREQHGKFKVSRSCVFYLEERRIYHRKDGQPVVVKDDLLAAARYGLMMRRFFKSLDECAGAAGWTNWPSQSRNRGGGSQLAEGIDFPLF